MNKKPAQLSVEEERARVKAIDFYSYTGKSEAEANRLAWADIQDAFPRLKEYDNFELTKSLLADAPRPAASVPQGPKRVPPVSGHSR